MEHLSALSGVRHASPLHTSPMRAEDAEKAAEAPAAPEGEEALRLLILRAVLKQWLGVEVDVPRTPATPRDGAEGTAQPPARVDSRFSFEMQQSFQFSLDVTLQNDAGETRQVRVEIQAAFSLSLDVRSQQSGEENMTDPLVVQLGDQPLTLARDRYRFDLNLDGLADALPGLNPQAAYLVLDQNGNGRVDDGRELFGPASGRGFSELAALDENGDGLVNRQDSQFARLQLWNPASGLQSLQQAGIESLSLKAGRLHERLYQAGRLMGLVREQSLLEGRKGALLEVDLRV